MVLAVIPARGGSKGLPGKNTKLLCGKPVISYTIEAALRASLVDDVLVTSDDDETLKIASEYDVRLLNRPAEYASDSANIDLALKHAVSEFEKEKGNEIDTLVWLQANVPVRKDGDIDKAVKLFFDTGADSVISVAPLKFPIEKGVKISGGKMVQYFNTELKHSRRQDYERAYFSNGAIYVIKRDILMRDGDGRPYDYFFGDLRVPYLMEKDMFGIEIDDEYDFRYCEMYMKFYG